MAVNGAAPPPPTGTPLPARPPSPAPAAVDPHAHHSFPAPPAQPSAAPPPPIISTTPAPAATTTLLGGAGVNAGSAVGGGPKVGPRVSSNRQRSQRLPQNVVVGGSKGAKFSFPSQAKTMHSLTPPPVTFGRGWTASGGGTHLHANGTKARIQSIPHIRVSDNAKVKNVETPFGKGRRFPDGTVIGVDAKGKPWKLTADGAHSAIKHGVYEFGGVRVRVGRATAVHVVTPDGRYVRFDSNGNTRLGRTAFGGVMGGGPSTAVAGASHCPMLHETPPAPVKGGGEAPPIPTKTDTPPKGGAEAPPKGGPATPPPPPTQTPPPVSPPNGGAKPGCDMLGDGGAPAPATGTAVAGAAGSAATVGSVTGGGSSAVAGSTGSATPPPVSGAGAPPPVSSVGSPHQNCDMDPVSTGMGPVTFSQQQIDHLVTLLKKLLSGLSAPQAPGKGAAQRGLPHGIGQALQSALLSPLSLDGDTLSLGGGSDEV